MIYNLEEYEEFITKLLRKVPLCYTAQLELALSKTFKNLDIGDAKNILLAIQRRGYVLLSSDGWAMTKGMVQRLTQQKFNEQYLEGEQYRLSSMDKYIKKSSIDYDTLDCLWVAIDMLPSSEDMVLTDKPWNISFIVSPGENSLGKLYQITKIPKDIEEEKCELLRTLPKIFFSQFKEKISRIALIEDERHTWMVPHIGFTYILKLDNKSKRMFSVIEKREGDNIWSDYINE